MANPTQFSNHRCPRCGAPLLTNGDNVWCSFVGGRQHQACAFGIDATVQINKYRNPYEQLPRPALRNRGK